MREPLGAVGTSGPGEPVSTCLHVPLHSRRAGGSPFPVLWPTCRIDHSARGLLPQRKGSKQEQECVTTGTWPPCPTCAAQGQHASAPGTIWAFPAPTGFPKLPGAHSPHRGHFCVRPLPVQQIREAVWGVVEAPWGLGGFSRVGSVGECQ